jgi:hypothetical protein
VKLLKEFVTFVKERHAIYVRRLAGKPKPWTHDPILQQYRFCNVYRELDTVTLWINQHWRTPWKDDPNVWFAMVVARVVNWPDSLYDLSSAVHNGNKINWSARNFKLEMNARKERGEKVWTGAYMIHADATEGLSKADYYADRVLTPLWEARKAGSNAFTASHGCGLAEAHRWLMQFRDMGSFMAAQVVCDVKYTPMLAYARDWWTWAAPGPGSLRGMSRVEFGDLNTKYTDVEWRHSLAELNERVMPSLEKIGMARLHAQDLQNCLCEFDKYQRVLRGEGRPRSKYPGGA